MSNLLADPSNWTDGASNCPPACWNGTSYVVVNSSATLHLNDDVVPADDDVIECQLSSATGFESSGVTLLNDGNPLLHWEATTTPTDQSSPLTIIGTAVTDVLIIGGTGCASDTVTLTPEIQAQVPCAELGRVTKCYVSGFQRNRVHESNVFPMEQRCLTADFNGAIPSARTITSATWSVLNPSSAYMIQGEVIDRETSVVVKFQYPSRTVVRCMATFDNGEQYTQLFMTNIQCAPWFQNDGNWATGPYFLTVEPA